MSPSQHTFLNGSELVSSAEKEAMLSQRGLVIWMTGLSGSGKSTLAYGLEKKLFENNILTKVLDGDVLRQGLNKDLGFSDEDRSENIRRTAELAKQLASCGVVVICSLITPTNVLRNLADTILKNHHFVLYHISTPLSVCEKRDVKGLYAMARKGEIKQFTGVSNVFEVPTNAIYSLDTSDFTIDESVEIFFNDVIDLITL